MPQNPVNTPVPTFGKDNNNSSLTEIKMSKMSMFNNTQYLYSPTLTENSCQSVNTYNN